MSSVNRKSAVLPWFTKVYTSKEQLIRDAATFFTRSNLGCGEEDPKNGLDDLYEGGTEKMLDDEFKAWKRMATEAVKLAELKGLPLSLKTIDELWEEAKNNLAKFY